MSTVSSGLRSNARQERGFTIIEMLVAVIQAYVFALLTSVYLNDAENLH